MCFNAEVVWYGLCGGESGCFCWVREVRDGEEGCAGGGRGGGWRGVWVGEKVVVDVGVVWYSLGGSPRGG